jgi:hypothetical protein
VLKFTLGCDLPAFAILQSAVIVAPKTGPPRHPSMRSRLSHASANHSALVYLEGTISGALR